jgi:polysaccharide pyruvyl transferase WcaK-like protein
MTAGSRIDLGDGWSGPDAPVAPSREAPKARSRAARRPEVIALFGLFGCGNMGNDASLETMLAFLRRERPEARLLCICDRPDVVARRFGIETVPISRSRHTTGPRQRLGRRLRKLVAKLGDVITAFREVRRADVVIVPGTGILDDFGERPYGMPFDLLRWCLAARLTGSRVAMVSIGAGPIEHPTSRRLMKAAARLAHYRSYRDELSRRFMQSIRFDTKCDPVYPDIVFGLEEPASPRFPCSTSAPLRVGVGVMSYYGWYGFAEGGKAIFDRYVEKLARVAIHLLDSGHEVRLLTGEVGDITAVERIRDEVASARPELAAARVAAEPIGSLHDLMRQIALTDLVIATRFHNIVCALKMGKPTVSLGYARKNDVLMAEMGLGDFCHHVEHFDVETVLDEVDRLAAARGDYERGILERSAAFKQQLERQQAELIAALL